MAKSLKLVIFDCDGTLVDSQHVILTAMTKAYGAHGIPLPAREVLLSVIGLSLTDDDVGTDHCALGDLRRCGNDRRGMDARHDRGGRMKNRRDARVNRIRVARHQLRQRRCVGITKSNNDRAGSRRRELRPVAGVGEKGDRLCVGVFEGRHSIDHQLAVAGQLRAGPFGQFAQRYACDVWTIIRFHALTPRRSLRPRYLSASALTTRSVMSMRGLA